MPEIRTHAYEAFLLFPQSASSELEASLDHVREIIATRKAELLSICKWDERRLAYDVRGNKRGLYILAYFRCETPIVAQLERDFNLSEKILRALLTRCDHLTEEEMRNVEAAQKTQDEVTLKREPAGAGAGTGDEDETSGK